MTPTRRRTYHNPTVPLLLAFAMLSGAARGVDADQVILKNGGLIQGIVDRDDALVSVFSDLKRTVVRHSKVARIAPEPASARQAPERFTLIQPLEVHGGEMPSHALRIRAAPWDDYGQRLFEYSIFGSDGSLRAVRMKQAINELRPDFVRFRGIDGFWLGQVATSQVPREVIVGLLDRVDPANTQERLRVARFLIQAGWYDDALAELERLQSVDPTLQSSVTTVRGVVADLRTQRVLDESERLERVGQPASARGVLATFNAPDASASLRDALNRRHAELDALDASRRTLASRFRADFEAADPMVRAGLRDARDAILQGLDEAPDAALERFGAPPGPEVGPGAALALVVSHWAAGPDHATDDPQAAATLWDVRSSILSYLGEAEPAERARLLNAIRGAEIPLEDGDQGPIGASTVASIVALLPPPRASSDASRDSVPLIRRVLDDPNATPTDYALLLPPEYHPLRSYPAVVALHDGRGPRSALDWWGPEAARNGYIVVAPEYNDDGDRPDFRYSPDEHAAVMLALRDARKRFAIDPDRVFAAGSLIGGNAAWDVGLAHPDVFAGAVTLSGLPAKYVAQTRVHAEYLPFYVVIGDMATAATEALVFETAKSMIAKTWDVTYVEYVRRGLEPLPEELPDAFDWMDRRVRSPSLKEFEVVACRPSDDRYYGLVIREFSPGRTATPESVDPLGRDLNPASIHCRSNALSNLLSLDVSGVEALDVWLSPDVVDFDRPIQIRVNGNRLFNDRVDPDLEAMLEDVRLRSDRGQLYWAKIPLGGKRRG